jgi:hypothetical protein
VVRTIIAARRFYGALRMTLAAMAICLVTAPAAARADVGVRDFSYGPAPSAPTGEKPQSKLWFNDGSWWGTLYNGSAFDIFRFDRDTNSWLDTGVVTDARSLSTQDTLWDGSHLYVLSGVPRGRTVPSPDQDLSTRVLRYTYDPGTRSYTRDSGFPVHIPSSGTETEVIAEDTTGRLWMTDTRDNTDSTGAVVSRTVYVAHSTSAQSKWITPYRLPAPAAAAINPDDISTVVAFAGQVGVFWSDQNTGAFYFATHRDGDSDDRAWSQQTVLQGVKGSDDHMNVKTLANDPAGQVFAAVKTSRNDLVPPNPADPLMELLVRSAAGTWRATPIWRVADEVTRPSIELDPTARRIFAFASAPCCDGGTIYEKVARLDAAVFPEGLGTPFIQGGSGVRLNNATTSKQPVSPGTGLLVLAGDVPGRTYWHNFASIIPPPPPSPPAPPPVAPTSPARTVETAMLGRVRAELSYVRRSGSAVDLRLRIVRRGRTALDTRLARACRWCRTARPARLGHGRSVSVRSLDGGREPQVLVDLSSPTRACCELSLVYRWDGRRRSYRTIVHRWGSAGYRLRRLDAGRAPEFVTRDTRFARAFTDRRHSYLPLQVWRYRHGRLELATRRYRAAIGRDAAAMLRTYRRLRGKRGEVRGVLAAYAADECLLARNAQGERTLRAALRRGDLRARAGGRPAGSAYLTALRRFLRRAGYTR